MKASESDLLNAFDKIVNCEGFEWDDVWDQSALFAEAIKEGDCVNIVYICLSKLDSKESWERLFAFQILRKSGKLFLVSSDKLAQIYNDVDFFRKVSIVRTLVKRNDVDSIEALMKIKDSCDGILIKSILWGRSGMNRGHR